MLPVPAMAVSNSQLSMVVMDEVRSSVPFSFTVIALLKPVPIHPICKDSMPPSIVVGPELVKPVPESVHVPVPALVRLVAPPALSTSPPASSPVPAVEPCSVSVLAPEPVAVIALVNFNSPVPDWSTVPPPVVPARFKTRSVVSPVPAYLRVPAVVRLPRSIVPLATVVGAPMLLFPPLTLLIDITCKELF